MYRLNSQNKWSHCPEKAYWVPQTESFCEQYCDEGDNFITRIATFYHFSPFSVVSIFITYLPKNFTSFVQKKRTILGLLLVQVILNTYKQTKARSNDSVTVSVAGQQMGVLQTKIAALQSLY